jgi:hypothetical protein
MPLGLNVVRPTSAAMAGTKLVNPEFSARTSRSNAVLRLTVAALARTCRA